MKILFLDIDGVLNDHDFNEVAGSGTFKRDCVSQLNRVIHETNCKVILHSAWRYMILNGAMTLNGFSYMLRTHGVTEKLDLIGVTPSDESYSPREHNIMASLVEWNVLDKYAIVDDMDLKFMEPIYKRFVKTNPFVGLTSVEADKLIGILS